MSQSDQPEKAQESWLDRIKTVLGLSEQGSIRTDIEDALQEPHVDADFSPKERMILVNVLGMRDVRVADVMTPRARIVGVSETASLSDLLELFRESSYARLPVYGETLDDPKGMVHIRDLLTYLMRPGSEGNLRSVAAERNEQLRNAPLLRPTLFVPPSTPTLDLLVRMQTKRVHMALIIDEYGETDGLVTMEDLVEVIVGDIEDEHDDHKPAPLEKQADGSVLAAASATLDEVRIATGVDIGGEADNYDVDSIGGYVTALAGRVPQAGETIEGPSGLRFEVTEAAPRRIKRLIIHSAHSGELPTEGMSGLVTPSARP